MILDLTVRGDERATEHVQGLARRMGNLEPLFTLMAHDLYRSERRQFEQGFTKGIVIGEELRLTGFGTPAERIRSRKRRRRVRYTLRDTGRLERSLTLLSSPDNVLHPGRDGLEFGTSVFYAKFLKRQGFNLVPITKRLREDLSGTALDYFLGGAE